MDHLDIKLVTQFMKNTKRHRLSFLERLEHTYGKNQDKSDVIDIDSLAIVKDKGHLKGIKRGKKFGSISSYNCKSGRKTITAMIRRVKIKNKIRLFECADEDQSSPNKIKTGSAYSYSHLLKESVVKLKKLDTKEIGLHVPKWEKSTSKQSFNRQLNENVTIDDLSLRKVKTIQTLPVKKNTERKLENSRCFLSLSPYPKNISICDLSFSSSRFLGCDLDKKKKSKSFQNRLSAKKSHQENVHKTCNLCMELEQEVETTEYYLGDCFYIHKKNSSKAASLRSVNSSDNNNFNSIATSKASDYERNMHSKHTPVSSVRPLSFPKGPPQFNSNLDKPSTPCFRDFFKEFDI